MSKHIIFLLLGSNLGDRMKQLEEATALISESIGMVILQSSTYETEPWGFSSDDKFLNKAVKAVTVLTPVEILVEIDKIEKLYGRQRQGGGYSSRTLDIDLLFYDDLVIDQYQLKIPHPRIQDRRFVLVPMNEIAPLLIHPVIKKTIGELLFQCSDEKEVQVIPG
jgi:2-amino-4-hydroxy-6-hydroxymethyldihydropteridine diphosphokinase